MHSICIFIVNLHFQKPYPIDLKPIMKNDLKTIFERKGLVMNKLSVL